MSSHLQWQIIKNNSAFLMKRNNVAFSKEAGNLKNRNSFRYNGLIHQKTVDVQMQDKQVVLVTKKSKGQNKPANSRNQAVVKGSDRAVLSKIKKTLRKNRYRKDLKMAAVRKAAAMLKSQKAQK